MERLNLYETNESESYFSFGYRCLTSENDNKFDYKTAFNCFKKAYALGHIDAAYYLGLMYMNGTGVERDIEEAKKYFDIAAKTFNTVAMLFLGNIYYKEKNYALAEYWYNLGAKFGNPFAMYNLGLMYKNGKASIKNSKLARYWLEESLKKGFSLAKKKIIKFYIN